MENENTLIEEELENLYLHWKKGDITKNYICRKLGVSKSTLYRILKKKQKGIDNVHRGN